jgi:hypothetical protein
MDPGTVQVSYLELRRAPGAVPGRSGRERVAVEGLGLDGDLALYRRVGAPVRWDQLLHGREGMRGPR